MGFFDDVPEVPPLGQGIPCPDGCGHRSWGEYGMAAHRSDAHGVLTETERKIAEINRQRAIEKADRMTLKTYKRGAPTGGFHVGQRVVRRGITGTGSDIVITHVGLWLPNDNDRKPPHPAVGGYLPKAGETEDDQPYVYAISDLVAVASPTSKRYVG